MSPPVKTQAAANHTSVLSATIKLERRTRVGPPYSEKIYENLSPIQHFQMTASLNITEHHVGLL